MKPAFEEEAELESFSESELLSSFSRGFIFFSSFDMSSSDDEGLSLRGIDCVGDGVCCFFSSLKTFKIFKYLVQLRFHPCP